MKCYIYCPPFPKYQQYILILYLIFFLRILPYARYSPIHPVTILDSLQKPPRKKNTNLFGFLLGPISLWCLKITHLYCSI